VKVIYPVKIPVESLSKNKRPKKIIDPQPSRDEVQPTEPSDTQEDSDLNLEVKAPKPLIIKSSYTIEVDSNVFDLELFDHRIKDGDMVSINVNGEWLFNNISLEKESRILRLTIEPGGDNFVLIQAQNIGWRPPNTIGVRYFGNGRAENFFLVTDLYSSEVIEIKYRMR